jgi:hypothetical protein
MVQALAVEAVAGRVQVKLEALVVFMAVGAVAVVVVFLTVVLEALVVLVQLKFFHGDKYVQICTYKQSKHC